MYYLSEEYRDYITYDSSHLREYRFRVSGTKKEVRDWKLSGKGADYFRITDYGLLQMDWEPAYIEPCVTATVTAIMEDGRKLTANVQAYSETNVYIEKIFTDFEKQYITSSMSQKEKAEKAAWYISTTSDYELYNPNWFDILLKGKGIVPPAVMLCSICATIWGLRQWDAEIWMHMGKRWSMQMISFMSLSLVLTNQSRANI